jgi:hypothetical protein
MTLREPLDAVESRIFGVLVEKSLTTPESYPLSLNALVNGCNQKSNRDPVTSFDERTVSEAILRLRLHRLVLEMNTAGSRVTKFDHDGCARLEVDKPSLAVLAELLLRGPQQPGELRGRASRMAPIESLPALEALLADLAGRGMVERLSPAPGSRAARWQQLLTAKGGGTVSSTTGGGEAAASPQSGSPTHTVTPRPPAAPLPPAGPTLADLKARVDELERRIASLEVRLDD